MEGRKPAADLAFQPQRTPKRLCFTTCFAPRVQNHGICTVFCTACAKTSVFCVFLSSPETSPKRMRHCKTRIISCICYKKLIQKAWKKNKTIKQENASPKTLKKQSLFWQKPNSVVHLLSQNSLFATTSAPPTPAIESVEILYTKTQLSYAFQAGTLPYITPPYIPLYLMLHCRTQRFITLHYIRLDTSIASLCSALHTYIYRLRKKRNT